MVEQLMLLKKEEVELHKEKNSIQYIDVTKDNSSDKQFSVVSLFSGCGGMDLGFRGDFNVYNTCYEKNNFEIIYATDIDKSACETYEYNFRYQPKCQDIRDIENNQIPLADIVIGGFPCQDFSHSGKRKGLETDRGRLYLEMRRVIKNMRPKAFVAENVDGIRTSRIKNDHSALDKIIDDFKSLNYNVIYHVLNAADYGVPQIRNRVFIIGIRGDLRKAIYYPSAVRGKDTFLKPWMTSKEAIDDLWSKIGDPVFFNHTEKDYSKAKFYPGKKMQGNYQIQADRPSNTIRAEHHGNIEAHYRTKKPDKPEDVSFWRRLSVRECARLQSFPDDFVFPCSASRAYKQIGNAVPPVLAWYISRALYFSLTKS